MLCMAPCLEGLLKSAYKKDWRHWDSVSLKQINTVCFVKSRYCVYFLFLFFSCSIRYGDWLTTEEVLEVVLKETNLDSHVQTVLQNFNVSAHCFPRAWYTWGYHERQPMNTDILCSRQTLSVMKQLKTHHQKWAVGQQYNSTSFSTS